MAQSDKLDPEELLAHAGWVRQLAVHLTRDTATADDLAQDTLVRALTHPPSGPGDLRAWLRRVLDNLARSRRRSELRRLDREALAAENAADRQRAATQDELLIQVERQQHLARLVTQIREPYRSVLLARYYRGESPTEIARRTNVSAGTVRSQIARGLSLVRERLDRDVGPEAHRVLWIAAAAPTRSHAASAPTFLHGLLVMKTSTQAALTLGLILILAALSALWLVRSATSDAPVAASRDTGTAPLEITPADLSTRSGERESTGREPVEATDRNLPLEASARRTRVKARIVDKAHRPLADGVLRYVDPRRIEYHACSAPSTGDGRVELELADEALVVAWTQTTDGLIFASEAEHHALTFFRASPDTGATTDLGEIVLEPGGSVSGFILDENGRGAPDVEVVVADLRLGTDAATARYAGPERGLGRPRTRSDGQGRYHVTNVRTGGARVWARADGGLWSYSEPLEIQPGFQTTGVDVELTRVSEHDRITVHVVGPDGGDVPQARVYATPTRPFDPHHYQVADEEGRLRLLPDAATSYVLVAEDPHDRWPPVLRQAVAPGDDVELQLNERRRITLRVTDSEGQPVQDVNIALDVRGLPSPHPHVLDVREQSGVQFSLALPDDPFWVTVSADGFVSERLGRVDPAEATDLTVELQREQHLRGRVTADGRPLAGATVSSCRLTEGFRLRVFGFQTHYECLLSESVETAADGRFALPFLPSKQDSILVVRAPGWARTEWGPFSSEPLPDGARTGDLEIEMLRGGTLTGRVFTAGGVDPAGQLVMASRGDADPHSTRTDEDGRFTFEHLTPGDWRVEHRMQAEEAFVRIVRPDEFTSDEWSCEVVNEATTVHDIDLTQAGDVTFSGRLLIDSQPATGWSARLHSTQPGAGRSSDAVLDAHGMFELQRTAGTYQLTLSSPTEDQGVTPVQMELTFPVTLRPTGSEWSADVTTGRLRGSVPGATTVRWRLEGSPSGVCFLTSRGDGTFEASLPAGAGLLDFRDETPEREGAWSNPWRIEVPSGASIRVDRSGE